MQHIEIKLLPKDDMKPGSDEDKNNSVNVEVQRMKQGVAPTIMSSRTISGGGEAVKIEVPDDGKLILTFPATDEELIYDANQSAAIRPSTQRNSRDGADVADPEEVRRLREKDKAAAEAARRGEARGGVVSDNRAQDSGGPQTVPADNKPAPTMAPTPPGGVAKQPGPQSGGATQASGQGKFSPPGPQGGDSKPKT